MSDSHDHKQSDRTKRKSTLDNVPPEKTKRPQRIETKRNCQNVESSIKAKIQQFENHNVRVSDNTNACRITGIAITTDGRRLLVDTDNRKVKTFSRTMDVKAAISLERIQTSASSVYHKPWDIATLADEEVVVTMSGNVLVVLN